MGARICRVWGNTRLWYLWYLWGMGGDPSLGLDENQPINELTIGLGSLRWQCDMPIPLALIPAPA